MLSREQYEKFMRDIQKQIEVADKNSRQKAEFIIKSMTDNYNGLIAQRIAYELQMAEDEVRAGNLSEAERHRLIAEIYTSVLNVTKHQE